MTFGHPTFLWALLAVPAPLLLHLFFRRRRAHVPFSTLQFFHPRRRDLAHRRRVREWLLLLIRTLTLLALALALARPRLQSGALAARTHTVLVLDDTLSMGRRTGSGETAFEWAAARAGEILDTLGEGDGAALVLVSGQPGIALTRKRQLVRQRLESAQVTGATGSFAAALQQAADCLATDGTPNREIVVLSDFPRSQAPATPVPLGRASARTRLYLLPVAGTTENLALEPLKLPARPPTVGKRLDLPFRVRNTGETDRETEVSLLIDRETRQTLTLNVPARATADGAFAFVPDRPGTLYGSVRLTDRHLALDNARPFALTVSEHLRVLLAEPDLLGRARPFHFLKPALDPDSDAPPFNGIRAEPGFLQELTPRDLEAYHAVILANPQPLTPTTAALLSRYLDGGGTVLAFAGPDVTAATFAASEHERLRGLFGERQPTAFNGMTFKGPLLPLNDLVQMNLLNGQRLHTLNPSPSATLLAETLGRPVLVEERVGAGRFVACALSCRRDYSNWPVLKSFPVCLLYLLTHLIQDPSRNVSLDCGARRRLAAQPPDTPTLTLRHSEGATLTLPVERGAATLSDTWQPGILTAEHASPRCAALNPAASESDLTPLDRTRLTALADPRATLLLPEAALEPQLRAHRRGSDLTGLLLLLAAALLLLEPVVGAASHTLRPAQPPARRPSP